MASASLPSFSPHPPATRSEAAVAVPTTLRLLFYFNTCPPNKVAGSCLGKKIKALLSLSLSVTASSSSSCSPGSNHQRSGEPGGGKRGGKREGGAAVLTYLDGGGLLPSPSDPSWKEGEGERVKSRLRQGGEVGEWGEGDEKKNWDHGLFPPWPSSRCSDGSRGFLVGDAGKVTLKSRTLESLNSSFRGGGAGPQSSSSLKVH